MKLDRLLYRSLSMSWYFLSVSFWPKVMMYILYKREEKRKNLSRSEGSNFKILEHMPSILNFLTTNHNINVKLFTKPTVTFRFSQALFYSSLRCSREMLALDDGSKNLVRAINNRLSALSFHIREYYWVDLKKINEIYRYKTEEYSTEAINKFNIYPDQIPGWLMHWIPEKGGYLIGNLQPAHMDFRFFTLGNLWSIVSSLGTPKQNEAILNLIEAKWDDLIGQMPLKICYPALKAEEWRIITGCDPKNT